jgi:hypothetical protein
VALFLSGFPKWKGHGLVASSEPPLLAKPGKARSDVVEHIRGARPRPVGLGAIIVKAMM